MKLRNSLAILAFSGAFLLAGCSNPTPAPAESSPEAASSQSQPAATSSAAQQTSSAAQQTSSAAQQTSSEAAQKVTVTFDVGEGSPIAPVQVDKGSTVDRPADPSREGYDFAGWYADEWCVTPYNFDTKVSADTTIFADWTPVAVDSSEEEQSIPEPADNVIYFRDDYWWNHFDGKVAAKFDDLDPVIAVDNVWIPVEAEDVGVNVWTINVPDGAQTVTFIRSYASDTEFAGPRTPTLTLSERTADVYDVYKEVKDWPTDETAPIVGNWISYGEAIAIDPWEPSGDSSETSGEEPVGSGFYFIDVDTQQQIVELQDQGEVDVYGTKYHQYHAASLSVTAGQKIALYDAEHEAAWAAAIDLWSFGSPEGSGANIPNYLVNVEGAYYEVVQDFTAEVFAKFLYQKDNVYFGLLA